jgi:hypothetical protein
MQSSQKVIKMLLKVLYNQPQHTVFTRLSAAALFKFSQLQMRRSFGGGAQSGAALFKQVLNVFVTKCPHFDGGKVLHCLVRRTFGGGAL